MPVGFGPDAVPAVSAFERFTTISLEFESDPESLAALMPESVRPTREPRVTIGMTMNRGVDYLGGRDYNLIGVLTTAQFTGERDSVQAPFQLSIWENDAYPILLGRETAGYPKLFATIANAVDEDGRTSFEAFEYDARIVRAEAFDLRPASAEHAKAAISDWSETGTLNWKYIPGPEGPDADYVTYAPARYSVDDVRVGHGAFEFPNVDPTAAPMSYRVLSVLRRLPVRSPITATVMKGSTLLPRNDIRRLR